MDAGIRAKGVAWLAVAVLACGLCYSLGYQSGWIRASESASDRLNRLNESLEELRAAHGGDAAEVASDAAGPLPAG